MSRDNKSGAWAGWPELTALRLSRKLSVGQIAAFTKIRTDYITAIEQGDFEKLPGGVYSTSYIRQYARLIDYPEHELLLRFNSAMATSAPVERQDTSSSKSARSWFFRWLCGFVL